MKRYLWLFTLAFCILIGFALAIGSTIGQGFISVTSLAAVFYQTIQNAGTPVAQEPVLNFTSGVTCTDNPGVATNCAASAGGGFIQTLTAPIAGNFSQVNFNTGSGVTSTQVNLSSPVTAITVRQQDPSHTSNMAILAKNKLAATFTVTMALSYIGDMSSQMVAGLVLTNGTTPIFFGSAGGSAGPWISILSNYAPGGGTTGIYSSGNQGSMFPIGLIWLRVQETVSARNYYVSSDGQTFSMILTESNTAHMTTSQYGFGIYFQQSGTTGDGVVTCYSFTETNP